MTWDDCCRNNLITNLANPGGDGMTYYAQIPDPALWNTTTVNGTNGNCTPDFGSYPTYGYFCLNNYQEIDFNVTDADGDSLVFSLVSPLDQTNCTGKPSPSSGFPYGWSTCQWAPGSYGLNNILGNNVNPPMEIDPVTGIITCQVEITGVFVFSIKVEEWRNGVKLGEVLRDIQYTSAVCNFFDPPDISIDDSISVYVDDQICFDIEITSTFLSDGFTSNDSIYLHLTSPNFDLQGNFVQPTIGATTSSYSNWMNSGNTHTFPNLVVNTNMIGPGTAIAGYGAISLRYCWTPACEDLDSIFYLDLVAVGIDVCGTGIDTLTLNGDPISVLITQSQTAVHVVNSPPPTLLNVPDTIVISLGDTMCIDLLAMDSININDTLFLQPYSGNFDFMSTFVPPADAGGGSYYYEDFITPGNTFTMSNYVFSGLTPGATGQVGLRFCWTTDCDYVFQKEFDLNYIAFSTVCGADTIFENSHIEVDPPVGFVEPLPNVFTPNGDGNNDNFKLKGTSDPCYDFMAVTIFNRWGQKVFESDDSAFEWDGTHKGKGDCKTGTYYVLIDGSFGSTYDPNTGERIPNLVKDEYWIQLLR
jgi:gliding motility-associated-like protein